MPDVVIKEVVATVTATPDEPESPHGTFEAILSAPVVDRDGETLHADEWEQPLPDRIPIDIDHSMSVSGTIGSARPWLDDTGNLRISGTFASTPQAQEVRTLVSEGHIRTTSVAFLRKQDGKSDKPRRELLNGAFVAVPANPAALVLDSKTAKESPARTRANARKVQAIHDHAYALGASCMPPAGKDLTALRGQLADIDTTALPEPVRTVLAALGVVDPDPATQEPPPAEPAASADASSAFAVRANQIRAMSALATTER